MINSKALKGDWDRYDDPEKFPLLKKIKHHAKMWLVYPITDNYRRYKERVKRSLAYAWFGWHNYDFDLSYAYRLFDFKLKRLYKCLENGHAIQEDEDMKALKELTKIVRRLGRRDYDNKYHRAHDRVWGKIESETIPNLDEKGEIINYSWNSWRSGTKSANKKTKDKERRQFRKCWENGEKDRIKDINRMAELLKLHGLKWWD
jgi:hypothetical protein